MPDDTSSSSPLLIMVSPTGARRTKRDHPALPMTSDEIAADACACLDAGAGALHVHVRDAAGAHTIDPDAYRAAFAAIERRIGKNKLVLQATSETAGRYQSAEQIAAMRALRPEAVSMAVRELLPDAAAEPAAADFFAWLEREKIGAQYIVYSVAELQRFYDLRHRGIIPGARPGVLHVLGRYGDDARPAQPPELLPFLAAQAAAENPSASPTPSPLPWMVCAFGKNEAACMLAAATLGGHARVGFENNLHLINGGLAPNPAALAAQVAGFAAAAGRRVVTDPDTAREILGGNYNN